MDSLCDLVSPSKFTDGGNRHGRFYTGRKAAVPQVCPTHFPDVSFGHESHGSGSIHKEEIMKKLLVLLALIGIVVVAASQAHAVVLNFDEELRRRAPN